MPLQLFKAKKSKYFSYIFIGIGIFVIYFFIMVNWMEIVRKILGEPNLSYDRQPEVLKFLNKLLGYLLWIIIFILFIRGCAKKNLVVAISIALGFLLSYLGLLGFLFWSPVVNDYAHRKSFDAVEWKDEKLVNSKDPVRIKMVDDLLNKNKLIGMSRNEVNDLLGVPPKTGYFSNDLPPKKWTQRRVGVSMSTSSKPGGVQWKGRTGKRSALTGSLSYQR